MTNQKREKGRKRDNIEKKREEENREMMRWAPSFTISLSHALMIVISSPLP